MDVLEEIEQIKVNLQSVTDDISEAELILKLMWKVTSKGSRDILTYLNRLEEIAETLNNDIYRAWVLIYKGGNKRVVGEYDAALKIAEEAFALFEKEGDKPGLAAAYNSMGVVYMRQANYPKSLESFHAVLNLRLELEDKEGIGNAYNNLGVVYADLTNLPESLKYQQLSLEIKKELNDRSGLATSYINIGAIKQKQSDYAGALKNFYLALPIMQELDARQWVGDLHNNIGIVQGHQGNFPEAMKSHLKALAIRLPLNDKHGIAQSHNSIADINEVQANYAEALKHNLYALQIWEEIGNKHGIAQSHAGVGEIYRLTGDFEAALKSHNKALALREEMNDKHGIVESYNTLGQIYDGQGNYDEALKNHLMALEMGEPLGNKRRIAFCYMGIGEVYEKQGRLADALQNKLYAFSLAEEIGSTELIKQTALSVSNCFKINRDFENALKYYEVYHKTERQTLGQDAQRQLHNLSFQHNLEQKEREAEINRLKYVELEGKNLQIQQEKDEAERQRKRAEQSEHFKQMFLANMSHEIRTPMNAIVGMTDILLSTPQTKESLHYLNAIKQSSDNLLVVVNDVLDISKIEAGKLSIEKIVFDLQQQLNMLSNIFILKADEKKLAFEIKVASNVAPVLVGDPFRLNQVLINLLGNAFKFTHKGKVTLDITRKAKNQYQFKIQDTGIGIAPEKLALIFESFSQAESNTTRQYGGTGLGLTISKQLVELMGGKIEVTSKAGKGSEFSFVLQLNEATAADLPKQDERSVQSKAEN